MDSFDIFNDSYISNILKLDELLTQKTSEFNQEKIIDKSILSNKIDNLNFECIQEENPKVFENFTSNIICNNSMIFVNPSDLSKYTQYVYTLNIKDNIPFKQNTLNLKENNTIIDNNVLLQEDISIYNKIIKIITNIIDSIYTSINYIISYFKPKND